METLIDILETLTGENGGWRWGWLVVVLAIIPVIVVEWRYAPVAWDIVSYAENYYGAHARLYNWSWGQYWFIMSDIYLRNYGSLLAIALLPLFVALSLWLLAKASRRMRHTKDW